MELQKTKKIGRELIERHKLADTGWIFKLDYATRRFGQCNFKTKTISISTVLARLNDEEIVSETILHEIAHALVGARKGHGQEWRAKALEIGSNGNRTYGSEVRVPERKYKAVCPVCKEEYYRERMKKRKSSCGKCSRTYNEKYLLTYKLNKQN